MLKAHSGMLDRMRRLMLLIGLVVALAAVFPEAARATSFIEVKKLLALDANAGDEFGISVAVSGDTAVVGAEGDAGAGNWAGAAYVLQRDQGGADNWGEVKKLTASDAEDEDFLGVTVAVSGDTAVVGAGGEDSGGSRAGAAYVFQRDEGGADNWGEVKKLTASDAQAEDWFGLSIAISGDTIVVGARKEDEGGTERRSCLCVQTRPGGRG